MIIYTAIVIVLPKCVDGQQRVIGYFPAWSSSIFPASSILFSALTHVNHAFAAPDASGNLTINAAYKIPDHSLISAAHSAGVKVSLSLGGATESAHFPAMTANVTARKNFVTQLVGFLTANGYDGVDIDWEGPANNEQKKNLTSFVKELDSAFAVSDTAWTISMAVGATHWSGQWHDYEILKGHVDWFNIMTYDFHGMWNHCGHNSPLNSPSGTSCADGSVEASTIYHTITRGIPKKQIVIGIPFYGYRFEIVNGQYGLYSSITKAEAITYANVQPRIAKGSRVWDSVTKTPWLMFSPPVLISYDDSLSVILKCRYAKENGLGGVMIWALGYDVLTDFRQPLMTAVGAEMATIQSINVGTSHRIPEQFVTVKNYPNPFNSSTTIQFTVPGNGSPNNSVRVVVVNVLGKEIAELVDGTLSHGTYHVRWDAGSAASGLYLCRVLSNHGSTVQSMILIR